MSQQFWDERFQSPEYFYGERPNAFLEAQAEHLPAGGAVLSLGEGEGRNAVFLASRGHAVTALDSSPRGFEKLRQLAERRGVQVATWLEDVTQADLGEARWDGIVNVFCHLPGVDRPALYERIRRALRPGGVFLTEQFSVEQLRHHSGGPKREDMLLTIEELEQAFAGFDVLHAASEKIVLDEGAHHQGPAAVVRFIARKP